MASGGKNNSAYFSRPTSFEAGVQLPGIRLGMAHALFCKVALGAVADRGIRTPTSRRSASTPQDFYQTKEDRLIRIPAQQAIDQLPAAADNLAGQPHKGIHKGLEL